MYPLPDMQQQFREDLLVIEDEQALRTLEVAYLGRKGRLTQILRQLASLPIEQKKELGPQANQLKDWMHEQIAGKERELKQRAYQRLAEYERLDLNVTAPTQGSPIREMTGHIHPLSNFMTKVLRVFTQLGYDVAQGPEIETDYYNFEALNIPPDHPTRDTHDTFYIKNLNNPEQKDLLLRTHTSSVQVRYMQSHRDQLPIKVVIPGKTYRRDDDATHFPMFHQFEGLVIDKGLTIGHLKSTVRTAMEQLLGEGTNIRFRTSFFPFTEPSFEVDVTCQICGGMGCRTCKHTGWLELLGAGMVHPNVLRAGGIDPDVYSGFAFGTGIERLAMMHHAIPSIKYLYENDMRFLKQF